MSKEKLYILHEYGAPRHFESLFYLNNKERLFDAIHQVEFSIFKQFLKGLLFRNKKLFIKSLRNLMVLVSFLFTKNRTIVVGAAPYDLAIFYLYLLKRKHRIIYYSSWPYWDFTKHPKKIIIPLQLKLWQQFLNRIEAVGVTKYVREGLRRYTEDVQVIPHCVDNEFVPAEELNDGKFRIIYVGRLEEGKGIRLLIEMIQDLADDHELEWWFVGNGILKSEILELARAMSNVTYWGQVTDKQELISLYQRSDVIMLPSTSEKTWEELFGIVLVEGMACGVVPISTDCVGPRSIITNGTDGFIVPIGGKKQMRECLYQLKQNPERYRSMKDAAIKTVEKHYTIQRTAALWADVIQANGASAHE